MLSDTCFELEAELKHAREDVELWLSQFGQVEVQPGDWDDKPVVEILHSKIVELELFCNGFRNRPGYDLPPIEEDSQAH